MPIERFTSDNPKPLANYTEVCRGGDLVFAAGQLATDFNEGIPSAARINPAFPYYGSDIKLQTHYILQNLARTFEAAGSSLDHVIKAQVFLADLNDFAAFDEVWKTYFKIPPARSTIQTSGLLIKDALIEIDLIGYVPRAGLDVAAIRSSVPRPIAHYTEAFRVGHMVFAAGQMATDFKTGVPASARRQPEFPFYGSDIKLQTEYILKNLAITLEEAGSSLAQVAKAQVFLTDLDDFAAFDEVWRRYFPVPPPRTTIGTGGLLVKDALIEIDLIAFVAGTPCDCPVSNNPKPIANYSEACNVDGLVFLAGQLATDFRTGVPAEARKHPEFPFYGSDIKLQTRYILENCKNTLESAGCGFEDVIKTQVFLTDLRDFCAFDEVWKEYFSVPPPRSTIGTSGLLIKDALIEIDLIAVKPK